VETTLLRKDGTRLIGELNAALIKDTYGRPEALVATMRDITERKRAEEALRESEERYCSLTNDVLDSSAVGIFILDSDFRIVWVNQALERCFGLRRDEIIGKDKRQLIRERIKDLFEDPESFAEKVLATYDDNTYIENFECHVLPGGEREEHWLEHWSQPIRSGLYAGGRIEHYADTTERKRAEEELRASEQRYRLLFERNLAGVYRSTLDGRILDCNESYARIFGYDSREELLAHEAWELYFDAADREEFIAQLRQEGALLGREWLLRRTDGSPVWVLENSNLIEGEEGRPTFLQGTLIDITERKRAERLLQALNQAALAMERALSPEEIFATVAEELKRLGLLCTVLLTDESQKRLFLKYLSYEARAIKAAEKLVGLKAEGFSIPVETVEVYRKVIRERKTVFVENAEEVVRQLLPEPAKRLAKQIAKMLKVSKSIDAPLIAEDEAIGLLLVQSDDLTEDDIPAITAFAHQMAAAWRKARLMQDLERSLAEVEQAREELQRTTETLRRTLGATIQAMAMTVETRDPYTAGHQRQVANLARAIATEMGLSKEQIEGIRMAAVIHDIGKITVPTDILNKPTRLTEHEFGIIKCHPKVGYDILKTIEFPWPIAQIIFQHHERMDGSGYPQGLSGEEIILEARILGVADVVEAMASFRPYRPARGIDKALEEISQNRGILYDAEVVDACLKLFTEKGFRFE